ncbi:hypothetical protein MTR67_007576 [Solanum verrucosum]|uniref:Uncharacterized protein n=1 Tax=Solanum verrucosum TaxID=315347 RepID=A0AAF0Q049_SOLVR|nr:hypothetical protein MTR67_007576 [Solanum verrucosum]
MAHSAISQVSVAVPLQTDSSFRRSTFKILDGQLYDVGLKVSDMLSGPIGDCDSQCAFPLFSLFCDAKCN